MRVVHADARLPRRRAADRATARSSSTSDGAVVDVGPRGGACCRGTRARAVERVRGVVLPGPRQRAHAPRALGAARAGPRRARLRRRGSSSSIGDARRARARGGRRGDRRAPSTSSRVGHGRRRRGDELARARCGALARRGIGGLHLPRGLRRRIARGARARVERPRAPSSTSASPRGRRAISRTRPRRTRSTRRTPTRSRALLESAQRARRAHEPAPRRARAGASRDRARRRSRRRVARVAARRSRATLAWPSEAARSTYAERARRARAARAPRAPHRRARPTSSRASPRAARRSCSARARTCYIEMKLPPLLAVRAAGIEAALGTDSLASNASLDVLAEAQALADRFPSVPAWELVQDGDVERRARARPRRPRSHREGRASRASSRSTGDVAGGDAARVRPRATFALPRRMLARATAHGDSIMIAAVSSLGRARHVLAHDLRDAVRGERGRARARACRTSRSRRCASLAMLVCMVTRAHERDGVQSLGRSRRRREEPAHARRVPSPSGASCSAARRSRSRSARARAFCALAATLGRWPRAPRAAGARGAARLLVREALHVGRARVARPRARARARAARGSRWARRPGSGIVAAHGRRRHVALRLRRPLRAAGRALRSRGRPALGARALRHDGRARHQRRARTSSPSRALAATGVAAPPRRAVLRRRRDRRGACSCTSTRSSAKAISRRIDKAFFDVNAYVSVGFFALVVLDEALR